MTPTLWAVLRCEVGGAVAAAVVWAITRLVGRHLSPRWRCGLWLLVLARLCLPVLPAIPVHLPRRPPLTETVRPASVVDPAGPETEPGRPGPVRGETPRLSPGASPMPAAVRPSRPFDPVGVLFGTWVIVAVTLLARLAVRTARTARLVRSYPPLADADLLAELSAAAAQVGGRPPPAVVSPAGTGPAVTGLVRPRLLVPADFADRLAPNARRLVLLHELAHVRRRDVPVGWVASAAAAVHWFNPAAWLALSQLRVERELAADAAVLDATGDRAGYGDVLVRLAQAHLTPSPAAASAMAEPVDALHRRITMIARHHRPARRHAALAIGTGLAVTAAMSVWTAAAGPASHPVSRAVIPPDGPRGPATTGPAGRLESTGALDRFLPPEKARSAPRFEYAGQVVDERGRPIPGVNVVATYRLPKGMGYIAEVKTDAAGRFRISQVLAMSGAGLADVSEFPIRIGFTDAIHAYGQEDDMRQVGPGRATQLRVTLRDGRSVQGQVTGPDRRPVPGVLVQVRFGDDYELRRATVSDAAGRFMLGGLPDRAGTVLAWTTDPARPALAGRRPVGPADADLGALPLVALPVPPVVHALFGMRLVDVDAPLQAAFGLYHRDGILVLDPGPSPNVVAAGRLQRGDSFWIVGQARVAGFAQFRLALLAASGSLASSGTPADCRVAYEYDRPDCWGTMTSQLKVTADRAAELKAAGPPVSGP